MCFEHYPQPVRPFGGNNRTYASPEKLLLCRVPCEMHFSVPPPAFYAIRSESSSAFERQLTSRPSYFELI
jgi:hypothetical protein